MTDKPNRRIDLFDYPNLFTNPDYINMSAWLEHIPLAMLLMELTKPQIFVELGTHYGVSYCAFCQAVQQLSLDTKCYAVDSWQGDAHAGEYSAEVLETLRQHHDPRYGSFSTLLKSTFDDALNKFADASIDLLHIDGFHTYEAVQHDFETWLPKLSERGIVVLHDINEYREDFGVWQLWQELKALYPTFEVMHGHGLGIVAVGAQAVAENIPLFELSEGDQATLRKILFRIGQFNVKLKNERDMQAQLTHINNQLANTQNTIEMLSTAKEELDVQHQQALLNLEHLQTTNQDLQNRYQQALANIEQLTTAHHHLEAQYQQTSDDIKYLQNTNQELEAQRQQALADVEQIKFSRQVLETQHQQALADVEQIKFSRHALETQYQQSLTDIAQLQTTKQELEVQHNELLTEIHQQLAEKQKLLDQKDQEIQQFQLTLENISSQLNDVLHEQTSLEYSNNRIIRNQRSLMIKTLKKTSAKPSRVLNLIHFIWERLYEYRLKFANKLGLLKPSEFFDERWYLQKYPDIAYIKINPYIHYLLWGWRELRDPNPEFSTYHYLKNNPDVLTAGMNPLIHYVQHGQFGGRSSQPYIQEHAPASDRRKIASSISVYTSLDLFQKQIEESFADPTESQDYESNQPIDIVNPVVKLVAFYLPQFHPTAENDEFWGKGFTEWTNVTRAQPLFENHYQPKLPGDLGFYDLRIADNLREQAQLARLHNISAFCIYRYWFNGQKVLDLPLELLYENKDIDIEYFLCWANESWSRRWDGFDQDILLSQKHSEEDDMHFIEDALRFFKDDRYMKIDNKPVLVVYRTAKMPDPATTAKRWQNYCQQNGFDGIYLIAGETFWFDKNPHDIGFDATVQFPPHKHTATDLTDEFELFTDFEGVIHDYQEFASFYTNLPSVKFTRFPTVSPAWDNTARRGKRAGIIVNSSPTAYKNWLTLAIRQSIRDNAPDSQFVFINAWNEWAEGAYLEPDRKYGYAYLNATSQTLESFSGMDIIFVGHDAARAGSQIVFLAIIEWIAKYTTLNIKVILQKGGVLLPDYQAVADTLVLSDWVTKGLNDDQIIQKIESFCGPQISLIYANTCASGKLLSILPYDSPVISHIHELADSIERYCQETIGLVVKHTDRFIAVSEPVAHLLQEQYQVDTAKISIINPFITLSDKLDDTISKESVVGDYDSQIVWGCGTVSWRKGFDIFVDVALRVKVAGYKNVKFCWIGAPNEDYPDVHKYLVKRKATDVITYLGEKDNPRPYFAVGDLFCLPSREDPHPLVAKEAAEYGLPIICFADTGGIPNFVGEDAGIVVPHLDEAAMAQAIQKLLDNQALREQLGRRARQKLLGQYTRRVTAPHLLSIIREVSGLLPKVSIVVPAYNHAKHLRKRLDSIYSQTFQDFEVILLDDGSPDGSADILREYAECHANTTLVINEQNTGSTFAQWSKGFKLAQADLIWIAEDDDFCEPTFLEKLTPYFADPAVKLAYCQSYAVDDNDTILFNYQQYTDDLSEERWTSPYIADAQYEVNFALAKKNTIPNASGVVFRKFDFAQWEADWDDRRLAGDWALYLYAIRDGKIAFDPEPLNYHRRHENTNIKRYEFDERRFIESVRVQRTILDLYEVDPFVDKLMHQGSLDNWIAVYPEQSVNDFDKIYKAIINGDKEKSVMPRHSDIKANSSKTIFERFQNISDEEWYSLVIQSLETNIIEDLQFPSFPEAQLQRNFTGRDNEKALQQAFSFYEQIKRLAKKGGLNINKDTVVCDFGCGWGRITRFFLKDVPSENLVGLDSTTDIIEVCKNTFVDGEFQLIPYQPPYNNIADASFDIIYAFSVFSHLNPILVAEIMQEFYRILRPNGMIIITSRGKVFMDYCESLRGLQHPSESSYQEQLKHCFVDLSRDKQLYDDGQPIFYAEGGGLLPNNMYGESALPPGYFAREFGQFFDVVDHEVEQTQKDLDQVTIVLQKYISGNH